MRDTPADPEPLAAPGADAAPTPPAPQRSTAGPFLRYGDVDKATSTWRGSVLFLTRPGEGAPAGSAPPALEIEDADAGGQLAAAQSPPALLDSVLGWDFWRFDLSFKLGRSARPVTYRVRHTGGAGEAFTFWLAGAGQPFHWGYTSCNGFSGSEWSAWGCSSRWGAARGRQAGRERSCCAGGSGTSGSAVARLCPPLPASARRRPAALESAARVPAPPPCRHP
jgi:hypothetical protein